MNENYIVINGKKIELTEEQLKALGIKQRKNPFEIVERGEDYFYVNRYGDINNSGEGAKRAIKEVVDPFMKEHPEFVW